MPAHIYCVIKSWYQAKLQINGFKVTYIMYHAFKSWNRAKLQIDEFKASGNISEMRKSCLYISSTSNICSRAEIHQT